MTERTCETESLFQLTMWINNQFDTMQNRFEKKITKLQQRIKELEKNQVTTSETNTKTKTKTKSKTKTNSQTKRGSEILSENNHQQHKNPHNKTPTITSAIILVTRDGIKWIVQGDTYHFRSQFYSLGCMWSKEKNGWLIYTEDTLNHLLKSLENECPCLQVLWN